MRIDDDIESLVREALDAAVKRDANRFDAAMKAFTTDPIRRAALELAVAITAFVLLDLYGGAPTDDQIRPLADKIAELETWSSLTSDEVRRFLTAVLSGQKLDSVVPATAVILTFVVPASLLASKPLDDGDWWFNYLDRVEAAIEAAP
jgi:hypothetical protein